MSGGVDSSVAAALLHEQGFEVVGVTLQLYDRGVASGRPGTCCAGRDIADARRVAQHLGVPHYVLDYEQRFRAAVIDDFAATYAAGETPVPCVRCNQRIKFRDLLDVVRELEADFLATGHYVQRRDGIEGPELHRAVDAARDQSYFLFATTRKQLAFLRFPIGGMSKAETRAHAERLGLPVAQKPDSQDICFVPGGDYARTVEAVMPAAARPGAIVHLDGRVLGRHKGVVHFTVGQRHGLGLGGGAPLHVLRIEPEAAQVVVGPRDALQTTRFTVREFNWIGPPAAEAARAAVRVRSSRPPAMATLRRLETGRIAVTLDVAEFGVAPGQACVAYDGSRVVGGGWIERPPPATLWTTALAASA
ncbi:MAG: tRNA 2-thiouridine(34) synthase MnmA [Alphaproteobacteria bacterium]|nr:tRNA 2-thiouridine(34) synthase MnmA [Alphaproteobacteria bacterium]